MEKIYDWAMKNLPQWLMYKRVQIDSQHKMWFPRWGYSKSQIEKAQKKADELNEFLKWD